MTPIPKAVFIRYRNHRGEESRRKIVPSGIEFGASPWHPEPQWLLRAWDFDKAADRTFAMKDVLAWEAAP